jgi:hypothetical protein
VQGVGVVHVQVRHPAGALVEVLSLGRKVQPDTVAFGESVAVTAIVRKGGESEAA